MDRSPIQPHSNNQQSSFSKLKQATMHFKLSLLSTVALATLAAATPMRRGGEPASSCSNGPVQCCNIVQSVRSPAASTYAFGPPRRRSPGCQYSCRDQLLAHPSLVSEATLGTILYSICFGTQTIDSASIALPKLFAATTTPSVSAPR